MTRLSELLRKKAGKPKLMLKGKLSIIERRDARKKTIGFRKSTREGVLFAVYDSVTKAPEYIPPEASDIELLMNDLVDWYNKERGILIANYKNVRITSYSLAEKYVMMTLKDIGFIE